MVLVRDNLNTHLTAGRRRYIDDRDWLTVFQPPPYAPDLNPVEGIWSVLRRTPTANRAFADPGDLISAVRRGLRQLQYRHGRRATASTRMQQKAAEHDEHCGFQRAVGAWSVRDGVEGEQAEHDRGGTARSERRPARSDQQAVTAVITIRTGVNKEMSPWKRNRLEPPARRGCTAWMAAGAAVRSLVPWTGRAFLY
ncbi:transposase [Streptomyces albogriseolus]